MIDQSQLARPQRAILWPQTLLAFLGSFEVMFVLFLFAGRYKALIGSSIDLTAVTFVLSVAGGLLLLWKKHDQLPVQSLYWLIGWGAFVVYAVASLMWSPSVVYSREKAMLLLTLSSWCAIASALIIAPDPTRIRRFFRAAVLLTVTIAVVRWQDFVAAVPAAYAGITDYLGVGIVVALGATLLFSYALFFARKWPLKLAAFLFTAVLLFLLMQIGARGPLVSFLAAITLPVLINIVRLFTTSHVQRYMVFIGVAVMVGIGYLIYAASLDQLPRTLWRMLVLFSGQGDFGDSADARLDHYSNALALFSQSPWIGNGLGSWPVINGYNDTRSYPHNIVLELMVELGLIGTVLLAIVLVWSLCRVPWRRLAQAPMAMTTVMLLLFFLAGAFVSGDLNDNRLIFAFAGMLLFLSKKEAEQ
ncbi:O-antigen ligase family protein [Aureibacillus halotolerans]|uniref:O-antigen ligase-like membrane protein n=1 Tax=Aureibacillus halotolerans TaxID=1508390 RepID=A0A4R6U2L5_9BACI|nr:O-antigen ligase family protein [Aureibacillus halotolerans]TDQ38679.1 O-antigen ligase-like membrane protein [Aureibacillus halotolerans]